MNLPQNSRRVQSQSAEFNIYEGERMNDIDLFLELPTTAQAGILCIAASVTYLLVQLLTAPRRNCFFFRWHTETRLLALLVSPALLILWPILLYAWLLKCRGIDPDDLDWDDD
jgi:hypothetical protein